LGMYRAAFTTMDQTSPLTRNKVQVPVIALGGEKGLGAKVKQMVEKVAKNVAGGVISSSGHFLPEEAPQEIVRSLLDAFSQEQKLKSTAHI
jgi:pimeloyl-ACP methyl ester carboxylesterase